MLIEQIAGAQAALESDIETLRHAAMMGGDGGALAAAQNQMSRLSGLQHRIESAQGGGLAAIRAEVMASVAASQTLAQRARASATTAQAAEAALHEASAAAHRVTGDFVRDFYEKKIFDPYLHFASADEERAYREREEASRKAIETARAEGTPEGELRALQISRAQLVDAGKYGAADSPDYQPMLNRIDAAQQPLEQALAGRQPVVQQQAEDALAPTESTLVSPDIIAVLRSTGTVMSDASASGHGVTRQRATEPGPAVGV
ncbi:hypothetical protein [Brevundimonas sp.]|uniref:hypothetical protein n=1 Tax=Brevundimonas sp. TaxID=1871086 RepID=UPI003BAB0081